MLKVEDIKIIKSVLSKLYYGYYRKITVTSNTVTFEVLKSNQWLSLMMLNRLAGKEVKRKVTISVHDLLMVHLPEKFADLKIRNINSLNITEESVRNLKKEFYRNITENMYDGDVATYIKDTFDKLTKDYKFKVLSSKDLTRLIIKNHIGSFDSTTSSVKEDI